MNETATLTPTSTITTDSATLEGKLKLKRAVPEDFYMMLDGKKQRLYGKIYFADYGLVDGIRSFSHRRFGRHDLSRKELAEWLRKGMAWVMDGVFVEVGSKVSRTREE